MHRFKQFCLFKEKKIIVELNDDEEKSYDNIECGDEDKNKEGKNIFRNEIKITKICTQRGALGTRFKKYDFLTMKVELEN